MVQKQNIVKPWYLRGRLPLGSRTETMSDRAKHDKVMPANRLDWPAPTEASRLRAVAGSAAIPAQAEAKIG